MVARGEVGLVIATILRGSAIIQPDQYVIAVVVIILTTIATPIMLAIGFHQLQVVEIAKGERSPGYRLNIGMFGVIGTTQMFNIINGQLEATGLYKTSIRFSEGRKIINVEDRHVKIILCPDEGIIFEGEREQIDEIVHLVKRSIQGDIQRLAA